MRAWIKGGTAFVGFMLLSSIAFATVPEDTVVIGNKAYDLEFANDLENEDITSGTVMQLKEGEKIFIKASDGDWYDNDGNEVEKNQIPEIRYIGTNGNIDIYGKGDGEIISKETFKISNVSFVDSKTFEVLFTQAVLDKRFSENIKFTDNIEVQEMKLNEKKDKLIVTLKNEIPKEGIEGNVTILKGIQNKHGEYIAKNFEEKFIVINESSIEDREFKENVSIIADGFKGKNLIFKKRVNLTGNNGEVIDSKAVEIAMNPGKDGNYKLLGVEIEEMVVLSGADHSIIVENCNIDELSVDSSSNTRIKAEGKSKINNVSVKSDAILETTTQAFENITVVSSDEEKQLTLEGTFKKVTAERNSYIKAVGDSKVEEVSVEGNVKVEGNFATVEVTGENSNIDFSGETTVDTLKVQEGSTVNVSGQVDIKDYEGDKTVVDKIKDKVEEDNNKNGEDKGTPPPTPPTPPTPPKVTVRNYNIDGVALKVKITHKYSTINGNKKYPAELEIDLGDFEVAEVDKVGIGIKVLDSKNNIIDVETLSIVDNKLIYKNLELIDGEGIINIVLRGKGNLRFVIEPLNN